ncbi:MAG: S8 family peptidase [Chloroflexota bacterium]|nr:S8 family peptidase [Chloroflexota bacterium]
MAAVVLGALMLAAPAVTTADSDGPYIVVFRDAVVGPAEGEPSAGRVDRRRVSERVSEVGRRHGVKPSNVFSSALGGFAANLTAKQVRALRVDPSVAAVVADVAVKLETPTTEDGQITATLVSVSAAKVPAGIRRVGATLNTIARIDKSDQRVGVDVAVLDTGIDGSHPDLNVAGGYNCTGTNRDDWTDSNGHGSHVAGTIAALDNNVGVVGVAPGARLWAVKIMGNDGTGMMSWILCGIDWVTAQRDRHDSSRPMIEVANMSIRALLSSGDDRDCGYPSGDAMHKAICRSVDAGTVYVAAAGNDKMNARYARPAAYDEVITVSAMTDYDGRPGSLGSRPSGCSSSYTDDTWAGFSNFGADVDLTGPGVCVLSTYSGGRYAFASGTSMAAPHVAGGAALYLAQYPKAKPQQVRMALRYVGSYEWRTSTDPDGRRDRLLSVDTFAPPPDFSVAAGGVAGSGFLRPSASKGLSFSLGRRYGHDARVRVSLVGLPSGISATPVSTSTLSGTIYVAVAEGVASGRYSATLRATDGELTRSAPVELLVDADAPTATFTAPVASRIQSSTSALVKWTESDSGGSGLAGRTLQRQRGRPSAPGNCSATTFGNDGTARTAKKDYTESLLTAYCYRWLLNVRDRAGNRTRVVLPTVLVDTSVPAKPLVGLVGSTSSVKSPAGTTLPAAWSDGQGTVWYRGGGSGRIDLRVASSDVQSGIAGATLAPTTGTAGWTFPSSVAGGDQLDVSLSYSSGASSLGLSVRSVNGARLKSSALALTARPDGTRPTDVRWSTLLDALTVSTTGSVQLSWSGGSDAGSGLAKAFFVRRQRAPVTATGGCGSFTVDGPAMLLENGSHDTALRAGYCYRWKVRATDRVGNLAPGVTSGKVRVDQ